MPAFKVGLMVGLLPLHHPFEAGSAQAHVVFALVYRGTEAHHTATKMIQPPACQFHVTGHHVGSKFRVF